MKGIRKNEVELDSLGLIGDRRMMLVDDSGEFLSQRTIPQLALFEPIEQIEYFEVSFQGDKIDLTAAEGKTIDCQVWDQQATARLFGEQVNQFFSDHLKQKVRLVLLDEKQPIVLEKENAGDGRSVGFVDGYPILTLSRASLAELNGRLDEPIGMDRFRPNLILEGCEAFEEDTWSSFQIGAIPFTGIKPCPRCVVTTINQSNLSKSKEPLKTLSQYRLVDHVVNFGAYVGHDALGTLREGDAVSIKEL